MKTLLSRFALAAILSCASLTGHAQTVQNGPYYAQPSWDQQLPASTRFIVLSNWNIEAVLDRETGLVWERQPLPSKSNWSSSFLSCHGRFVGNRMGWRLPSVSEVTSLLDPTQSNPALPAGHPFDRLTVEPIFWTASTDESDNGLAYVVHFDQSALAFEPKDQVLRRWCVRGGTEVPYSP